MEKQLAYEIYDLYHSSNNQSKRQAENMLITDLMPLIRYLTHDHLGRYDDVAVQEAALECLKYLKNWDPHLTNGNPASYFHYAILHGADRALRQETGMASAWYHRQLKKVKAAGLDLSSSDEDLMKALGTTKKRTVRALREAYRPKPVSSEALYAAGKMPVYADAKTPELATLNDLEAKRLKERLLKAISDAGLSEQHGEIICGVYDGKTFREITEEQGLTQDQVSYRLIVARKACMCVAEDEGLI